MEPLKQDRIGITGRPPLTSQERDAYPTRSMATKRTYRSSRSEQDVETGLSHVLNLRVGCWRPPVHVDLAR
jgi:hypothetical protein